MSIRRLRESHSHEWIDENGNLTRGKHKGSSVQSLARSDPSYLQWAIDNIEDMDEGDREIISQFLHRR